MPPKTSKNNQVVKKKTPKICPYNNRGYCKAKEECENVHSDKVCEDQDCPENNCDKRHPNPCKYGLRCTFNKKRECMYLHVTTAMHDGKIEVIDRKFEHKFETLENYVKKIETDIGTRDLEIEHLKGELNRLEEALGRSQIEVLKKEFDTKNAQINGLEIRLEEIEKSHQAFKKVQEKKIKDLENKSKQNVGKDVVAEPKIYKEDN